LVCFCFTSVRKCIALGSHRPCTFEFDTELKKERCRVYLWHVDLLSMVCNSVWCRYVQASLLGSDMCPPAELIQSTRSYSLFRNVRIDFCSSYLSWSSRRLAENVSKNIQRIKFKTSLLKWSYETDVTARLSTNINHNKSYIVQFLWFSFVCVRERGDWAIVTNMYEKNKGLKCLCCMWHW
jgi:hypothetical protein